VFTALALHDLIDQFLQITSSATPATAEQATTKCPTLSTASSRNRWRGQILQLLQKSVNYTLA
jgi:hypothetical protein